MASSLIFNNRFSSSVALTDVVLTPTGSINNFTASFAQNIKNVETASVYNGSSVFDYELTDTNYSSQDKDYVIVDNSVFGGTLIINLPVSPTHGQYVYINWPLYDDVSDSIRISGNGNNIKTGIVITSSITYIMSQSNMPALGIFAYDSDDFVWKGGLNKIF
jgi:hypothetical protein